MGIEKTEGEQQPVQVASELNDRLGAEGKDWKRWCMKREEQLRVAVDAFEHIAGNAESQLTALNHIAGGHGSPEWHGAYWYRTEAITAIRRIKELDA